MVFSTKKSRESLVEFPKGRPKRIAFEAHMYYMPLYKYGVSRSDYTYINMVREPADRLASFFYFRRSQFRWRKGERPLKVSSSLIVVNIFMMDQVNKYSFVRSGLILTSTPVFREDCQNVHMTHRMEKASEKCSSRTFAVVRQSVCKLATKMLCK